MAKVKQHSKIVSFQFKSLILFGALAITSLLSVIVSQPTPATAGLSEEVCASELINCDDISVTRKPGLSKEDLISSLKDYRVRLMNMAYAIGLKDGGHEHGEMLQAVLLQETIAGQLGRIGHMTARVGLRSYGVMQVKVSAARDVLRKNKELGRFRADELLIAELLTNDKFNMRVASKFLMYLKSKTKSYTKALVAYNIGLRASRKISQPNKFKYFVRTQRNLAAVVRPFNQRFADISVQLASN
jgi:hypothetical protein